MSSPDRYSSHVRFPELVGSLRVSNLVAYMQVATSPSLLDFAWALNFAPLAKVVQVSYSAAYTQASGFAPHKPSEFHLQTQHLLQDLSASDAKCP